jgi:predicted dehydrogenase
VTRLRVGVIGCGRIAQIMHLPYLRQLSELYEVSALCDASRTVLHAVGEAYGVARRFLDYRELLETELDAVLILTPGSHAPPALAALQAGLHVFVEKPMCFTLREADEMIAAAASGRTLMVGYMKRYDPGYRYAQAALSELGELRYIQINTLHPVEEPFQEIQPLALGDDIPPQAVAAMNAEKSRLAVEAIGPVADSLQAVYTDVVLGSLVHDVNALRGLVGEPQVVEFTSIWPPGERLPIITTMLRHRESLRSVFTWAYLPDYHDYFEEIALMGAAGRIRIQFPSPYLRNFPTPVVVERMEGGATAKRRVVASYAEAFREELVHFHTCATRGQTPLTDARDARRDIEILQQVVGACSPAGLGGEAKAGRVRQPAAGA